VREGAPFPRPAPVPGRPETLLHRRAACLDQGWQERSFREVEELERPNYSTSVLGRLATAILGDAIRDELSEYRKKAGVTGMAEDAAQLWLVTEVETIETTEVVRGERGGRDTGGGYESPRVTEQVKTIVRQRVPLDAVALKTQMNGLLQVVSDVFEQASQQRELLLDEVELSVEINAQGQVSIMGTGGSLSDKGAIKLKFKRVPLPT